MKHHFILFPMVLLLAATSAYGQGFIYDQQVTQSPQGSGGSETIQSEQPVGQSFTPSLSSIDFVILDLSDYTSGNGLGATVYMNLWSGSISNGTLMASTDPVFMPDGFGDPGYGGFPGTNTFFFATPVSLTPGTTYYLQPFVQSGDGWRVDGYDYNYSGGVEYVNGVVDPGNDLWFREGIIQAVPEPSAACLLFLGGGLFLYARHKRKKHSRI
jgi:PEP-CTERM motif